VSLYRFTGRDAQGGKIIGSREAGSADSLASELLAERITPLTIEEQAQARTVTCSLSSRSACGASMLTWKS